MSKVFIAGILALLLLALALAFAGIQPEPGPIGALLILAVFALVALSLLIAVGRRLRVGARPFGRGIGSASVGSMIAFASTSAAMLVFVCAFGVWAAGGRLLDPLMFWGAVLAVSGATYRVVERIVADTRVLITGSY